MTPPTPERCAAPPGGPRSETRVCVDALRGADWDEAIAGFDDGIIDQTWAYSAACRGAHRLSTLHLERAGHIVAACLVVIARVPLVRAGVAFAKFGPVWIREGNADRDALRAIVQALRKEYVVKRGLYLRIVPRALPGDANAAADALAGGGFEHTPPDDPLRYLVDLSVNEVDARAGLKSKWRYHLRKAESAGLELEHTGNVAGIRTFLGMYAEMRSRKDFTDVTATRHLVDIAETLPADLALRTWLCRDADGPVAAAVISRIGDTAQYLFGASNASGRARRAGYLLHWAITNDLRERDCRWYDLGGDCHDPGLRQFKSGLVGRHGATPALPGQYDGSPGVLGAAVARGLFGLRDMLANSSRRAKTTEKKKPNAG